MTEMALLRWVARLTVVSLLGLAMEASPYPPWVWFGEPSMVREGLREVLRTFLGTVGVLFLLVQPFLVQIYLIPSASMEPTLRGEGRGWRTLTSDRILVFRCWYWWTPPRRGDIVVFRWPDGRGEEQEFVKRVVGLPGEALALRDGQVWINGRPWEPPVPIRPDRSSFGPVTLPPGHYLVLGDHREVSADSRHWGPLPAERILGRALCIVWPPWRWRRLR